MYVIYSKLETRAICANQVLGVASFPGSLAGRAWEQGYILKVVWAREVQCTLADNGLFPSKSKLHFKKSPIVSQALKYKKSFQWPLS